MTIRSHIDAREANRLYTAFEEGCANAPAGTFEYHDERQGHVLVQDGDEERLIPIEEFGIPFKVQQDV